MRARSSCAPGGRSSYHAVPPGADDDVGWDCRCIAAAAHRIDSGSSCSRRRRGRSQIQPPTRRLTKRSEVDEASCSPGGLQQLPHRPAGCRQDAETEVCDAEMCSCCRRWSSRPPAWATSGEDVSKRPPWPRSPQQAQPRQPAVPLASDRPARRQPSRQRKDSISDGHRVEQPSALTSLLPAVCV